MNCPNCSYNEQKAAGCGPRPLQKNLKAESVRVLLLRVLWYSAAAGIIGTGLGGVLGVLLGGNSRRLTGRMFYFSSGVMLGIVFFDLLPEAAEMGSIWVLAAGIALGVAFVLVVGERVDRRMHTRGRASSSASMLTCGIVLCISVVLHNLPEGLVIGSSTLVAHGLLTTLLIAVHNVPEGMTIALPLVEGGQSKMQAVATAMLAGAPTVVGAAMGYYLGSISGLLIALCMAIAAGAMMCVVFAEMIPQAREICGKEDRSGAVMLIAGIILGLALVLALG